MTIGNRARVLALLTIACLVLSGSAVDAAQKKVRGTWLSMSVLPPNEVLGNSEPMLLPELETFSSCGAVLTSSAAGMMRITTDQGRFKVTSSLGQGRYRFMDGRFVMTQWRFLYTAKKGQPIGYLRIINEWTLAGSTAGSGLFRAEMFQLDMETPLTSGGEPIVIDGEFQIQQMSVERLPGG